MGESGADCSLMLSKGLEYIREATAADGDGRTRDAIRLYSLGLESLLSVLKFERNERITGTLRVRVREYMARAEQLKAQISTAYVSPALSLPSPPAAAPHQAQPVVYKPTPIKQPMRVLASPAETTAYVPSIPSAPHSTIPIPTSTPLPEIKGLQRVEIMDGQTGCSYGAVLGRHLAGATDITLCYPYLHSEHHIRNLLSFIELLVRQGTCRLLTLECSPSPHSEDSTAVSAMLDEVASASAERGVHMQVQQCDPEAAPYLLTSHGCLITLPRALDWFVMSTGRLYVGYSDWDLRPCRHTVIEMYVSRCLLVLTSKGESNPRRRGGDF